MAGKSDLVQELEQMNFFLKLVLYDGSKEAYVNLIYDNNNPFRMNKLILTNINVYASRDLANTWKVLEQHGIMRNEIVEIQKAFNILQKAFIMPVGNPKDPIYTISVLFYSANADSIRRSITKTRELIGNCQSDIKDQRDLFEIPIYKDPTRKIGLQNTMNVPNPYSEIPGLLTNCESLLEELNSMIEDGCDTSKLIYKPEFKVLSDIINQINDIGLTPEEKKLIQNSAFLMIVYSFAIGKVRYPLSQSQRSQYRSARYGDDQMEDREYITSLNRYSQIILDDVIDIDVDGLNAIMEKYKNEASASVLAPFIKEFVPLYLSYMCPKGYIKATMEATHDVKKYIDKELNRFSILKAFGSNKQGEHDLYFGQFVLTFLIDKLPFVMPNCPNDTFLNMFKSSLMYFLGVMPGTADHIHTDKVKFPGFFELESVEDLSTLTNQKLHFIWFLNEKFRNCGKINRHAHAMMFSMLDWKLDDDSNEAREFESIVKDFAVKCLDTYKLEENNIIMIARWQKFIKNRVLNATEPIPEEIIHKEFEETPSIESQLLGACCTVQ